MLDRVLVFFFVERSVLLRAATVRSRLTFLVCHKRLRAIKVLGVRVRTWKEDRPTRSFRTAALSVNLSLEFFFSLLILDVARSSYVHYYRFLVLE